ncbi:MAG: ribonuclease Y [Actinomycetota bacterium]|nr:ribonuclease Y [Actinomycetota bacterium]
MEILLAALVAAAVSGAVLLTPRLRRRPLLANGAETVRERKSDETRERKLRELERASGLSAGEARQALLAELEDELRHERARLIRQVEDETRHDAERRARSILATCMQRMASSHSAETTVTSIHLDSDELKGRIIGREGRNIRALETLTGIDVIVDDTPGTVMLSGFDGVRREIARLTLEKLLADGRIHPARIEEAYGQAKSELDRRIVELGEEAALDAGVGTVHPELTELLGRLRFRTSYGQNVLDHSVECARLATLTADELGANPKVAARAALLHDVGKAVSHEVDGPHALVGGELARRHGESDAVAHAIEAHHNEVEPRTVEAVIVQIVDALSGARPGARGESLEHYVARLHDLEGVATRHEGVEKVYAMHAGRELRVIVKPEEIDDDGATILSREIARDVERELEYPGQIKVTVIRESRAIDIAR